MFINDYNLVIGTVANSTHVINSATGELRYVLIGASMNPRLKPKSFKDNPYITGCCYARID